MRQTIGKMAGGAVHVQVEEFEGELKKVKNFWQSRKDTYLLKAHILLIKKTNNKTGACEYKTKYDLSMYSLKLSAKDKDKIILEPK